MTENYDNQPPPIVDLFTDEYFEGSVAGISWAEVTNWIKRFNFVKFIAPYRTNHGFPVLAPLRKTAIDFSVAEVIGSAIINGPVSETDRKAASEFWDSLEDSKPENREWLDAFCDGVIQWVHRNMEGAHLPQTGSYRVKYGEPGPNGGVVNEVFFDDDE